MTPSKQQTLVDAAWPTIERSVTDALGDSTTWPITKLCPAKPLGESTWRTDGTNRWSTGEPVEQPPTLRGLCTATSTRRLQVGPRIYTDVRHGMRLTADELLALTVAHDDDGLYRDIGRWATSTKDHYIGEVVEFLCDHAVPLVVPANGDLASELAKLPDFAELVKYRVGWSGDIGFDTDRPFVVEQIALSLPGQPRWRALFVSTSHAGIEVERATELTLSWQAHGDGVEVLLEERYAFEEAFDHVARPFVVMR
jgi:hypothetical protein